MAKNTDRMNHHRLAIVDPDVCKPSQCRLECKKCCPVVRSGKPCIVVSNKDKISFISEVLCIGCGCCVKKCPFQAISIINLPSNLSKDVSHRYGSNGFKLHRLPIPRLNSILGLVGSNGVGKSTCLKVLSGDLKPNLGLPKTPDWIAVLNAFKGSELFQFFTKTLSADIVVSVKDQYVDNLPSKWNCDDQTTVLDLLKKKDELNMIDEVCADLCLNSLFKKKVLTLSGGELQRLAIAVCALKKADVYFFDEPSSFLDCKQRLAAVKVVRRVAGPHKYVVVVEHDLAVLDAMCDLGCVLYGKSGCYGVCTSPYSIKQAINVFLSGFIPSDNVRFRDNPLSFDVCERPSETEAREQYTYPAMQHTYAGHDPSDITKPSEGENKNGQVDEKSLEKGHIAKGCVDVQARAAKQSTTKDNRASEITEKNGVCDKDVVDTKSQPSKNGDAEHKLNHFEGKTPDSTSKELHDSQHTKYTPTDNLEDLVQRSLDVTPKGYRLGAKQPPPRLSKQTPAKTYTTSSFTLKVSPGTFSKSEIIVLLGENGMGKTTLIKLIQQQEAFKKFKTSLKPQKIIPKFKGTPKELFMAKIRSKFLDTFFINEVIKPLNIEYLYDHPLSKMSGGELQRIAIVLTLGREADIYLFDEPSAFLDCEQRIAMSKVLKRYMYAYKKTCFVVEHDMIVATYLADKIIIFEGEPGVQATASEPMGVENAMNMFLKKMDVTFRRDKDNLRPRVNKLGSLKDREQKEKGTYFFT